MKKAVHLMNMFQKVVFEDRLNKVIVPGFICQRPLSHRAAGRLEVGFEIRVIDEGPKYVNASDICIKNVLSTCKTSSRSLFQHRSCLQNSIRFFDCLKQFISIS